VATRRARRSERGLWPGDERARRRHLGATARQRANARRGPVLECHLAQPVKVRTMTWTITRVHAITSFLRSRVLDWAASSAAAAWGKEKPPWFSTREACGLAASARLPLARRRDTTLRYGRANRAGSGRAAEAADPTHSGWALALRSV